MSPLREIEHLLYREARHLDLGQYADWLALYTEDCEYWVPAVPGQTDAKRHVSLFYEDRTLMETRIRRLLHPTAHSMVPVPRTSHIIGNVMLESEEAADAPIVRSSFHLLECRGDDQRLLGGLYTHELRREGGMLKIRAKRVDLVNCDGIFEILQLFI